MRHMYITQACALHAALAAGFEPAAAAPAPPVAHTASSTASLLLPSTHSTVRVRAPDVRPASRIAAFTQRASQPLHAPVRQKYTAHGAVLHGCFVMDLVGSAQLPEMGTVKPRLDQQRAVRRWKPPPQRAEHAFQAPYL